MALRKGWSTSRGDVDIGRDRALVRRCQAGDPAAFERLYDHYYERLLCACLRRLNDRHEAEDATQEAFSRAWKALPDLTGERRFYPWLALIAQHICTDTLRRRARAIPRDHVALGAGHGVESETSEESLVAAIDRDLADKALGRVSVRHRDVLTMREVSGWTYQQIAEHEGIEVGAVETLLWRARQALKREFAIVSKTKGGLPGFVVGMAAIARKGIARVLHRSLVLFPGGGGGVWRNTFAGIAVTSATVVAATMVPNAFSAPQPSVQTSPSAVAAGALIIQTPAVTKPARTPLPADTPASPERAPVSSLSSVGHSGISSVGEPPTGEAVAPPTSSSDQGIQAASAPSRTAIALPGGGGSALTEGLVAPTLANPSGTISNSPVSSVTEIATNAAATASSGLDGAPGLDQVISQLVLPVPASPDTTSESPTPPVTIGSVLSSP